MAPTTAKALLYLSGLTNLVATLTIIPFYSFGQPWGTINDFVYGVFALIFSFVLVYFNPIYELSTSRKSELTRVLGVVSFPGSSITSFLMTASEGSQRLLLALQLIFLLLNLIWLPLFGTVLKRAGIANALKMSLIALTGIGYPIWAVWLARQLPALTRR